MYRLRVRCQLAVCAVVLLAASACGPSSEQLTRAKAATYADSPRAVFARAVAATREHYQVGELDCAKLAFITAARAYKPDGEVLTASGFDLVPGDFGGPDPSTPGTAHYPFSYGLALYVTVVATTEGHVVVAVSPRVWGRHSPRSLDNGDPTMPLPSFALGRADALWLRIHDYEVQGISAPDPCGQVSSKTP